MISLTHSLNHAGSTLWSYSEGHTALLYVRTGDVQLNGRNMLQLVNTGCTLGIILRTGTGHIHNHIGVDVLNLRINVLAEIIHSLVLQSNAVEHSRCGLSHTRIRISLTRVQCGSLNDDTTQVFQIDEICKLQTVAECTGSGHHRILQIQSSNLYS